MKVSIIESSPLAMRFKVSGASVELVNALRRIMISRVKSFAIDSITFYINTSVMFDEYIAHRIGLVPIITPEDYDEGDEVLFKLEAEGPGTVYSKDLISSDKKVKVAIDDIPIMKLGEGQKIKLEGKAVIGNAAKSAKFQPGLVTYDIISDGEFEFYIETFGQMPAKDILERALDILDEELKTTQKDLK